MEYTCNLCKETFDNEDLLLIHYELQHNTEDSQNIDSIYLEEILQNFPEEREQTRPTVIQYAPKALKVDLLADAMPRSTVRHFKIENQNYKLYEFLSKSKHLIVQTLETELKRLNVIKFGILVDSLFTNINNELSPRGFITKNKTAMKTTNLHNIVEDCLEELQQKVAEHQGRGSGWSLLTIIDMNIRIHKHGYGERGSSYIPLPQKISKTKACINVKNEDNECFRYAMLVKYLQGSNVHRPNEKYHELRDKYNFKGISYPVSLTDINKFEKFNLGTSVNVFGLDKSNNIYPLRISPIERSDHTDLLLISNGVVSHYVYIKDFNVLVKGQLTKKHTSITVCKRCFCYVSKNTERGGKQWLLEHQRLCSTNDVAKVILPSQTRATVVFNKTIQQYRIPIVIYADFESTLLPLDTSQEDPSKRIKYQLHKPNSYCILIKSTLNEDHLNKFGLTSNPQQYRGENAASKFVDHLYDIASKVEILYGNNVSMKTLDADQILLHRAATTCYLCTCIFTDQNPKVRDHDHITGLYRGAACNRCNINFKIPRFIPIVFHNLSGYDAHFIIPELGRDSGDIDVLATSFEKFISFSKKVGKIKLRFVDSFKFMPSSLLKLTENLGIDDLRETRKIVPHNKINLVLRKGVFPYDYIDDLKRFDETSLPPAEYFYSKLTEEEVDPEDYLHACKVWEELNMKTLGEYNDFYIKLDVTLLCDVMEEFRNTCMTAYGLDPLHSYTSPGLAWQAMLKETKCRLELLTDVDMALMVESGVRGGLTQSVTRYVKANNKYLPNYDDKQDSIFLGYYDANNLYGWGMSTPLPYGNFKWVDPTSIGDITNIPTNGDIGYILDFDFEYPEHLHDHHYDLPLLARPEIPPNGRHPKLMMTLENKTRYVAHFLIVKQVLNLGIKVTKIHRVLQFSQSCWLQPYINSNTKRRTAASSTFQKDFFKLMNNAIFGKTLENKRKHKNVKLVSDQGKLDKLVRQPNFETSVIINQNLVAVSMKKSKIVMDRPLYVGMSILDISKTHMYDFHYNKMVRYYGRKNIGICYMDTDAYIYWIKTLDMYEDLQTFPYKDDFDFSDYPSDHPVYDNGKNKKVLGKFKDEANGAPIEEIVALMSKLYALRIFRCDTTSKDVVKKAKGVKNMYLKKRLSFNNYKQCLFENETYIARYNTIRSFNHKLHSITEVKKALSSHDNKRYILQDQINTLPYGHYSLARIDS